MDVEKVKKKLLKKKVEKVLTGKDFVSTGSTMLNFACTGNPDWGFAKGHYYLIVGDSASGKTFLSLTCLAEASINPNFDNYRFIYDNSEDGALMNIEKFFGKGVKNRLEMPGESYSSTIEEFYYHIDDAIREGTPFIYIQDSMDSLSSGSEQSKFEEQKKAYRRGREVAGSYGDGKAKINSTDLRKVVSSLSKSGSILIIVSQTRDNLGFGFEKKTRSGGKALKFYCTLEIWSSIVGKLKKVVKDKKRQMGVEVKLQVRKNRVTGREREVIVPIYHSFGIDDIGSCVDYLVDEGHWKKKGGVILAPEFKIKGAREKLIGKIEGRELELDLKLIVSKVWNEIEEATKIERKRRYE